MGEGEGLLERGGEEIGGRPGGGGFGMGSRRGEEGGTVTAMGGRRLLYRSEEVT